jgi:hypothetical protein
MPFDIQISLQKLLTGLIVVIVPLSIVGTLFDIQRRQQSSTDSRDVLQHHGAD